MNAVETKPFKFSSTKAERKFYKEATAWLKARYTIEQLTAEVGVYALLTPYMREHREERHSFSSVSILFMLIKGTAILE